MTYFSNLRFYRCAAAAVMLAAPAIVPALAAESETTMVAVSYADLNLASPAGVDALRHRLIVATRTVCGTADAYDSAELADAKACQAVALQDALGQLHAVVAAARTRSSVAVANAGN